MKMSFRWYGEGNDSVTLAQIKQIPGVEEIVWALHHKAPGEIWEKEEIAAVKKQLDEYGFGMEVVESVNVHDDIKTGSGERDRYIENYCTTLRNLSEFGVKVVCYNFMPVFDWTRTDLFHPLPDGSTALFYEKSKIKDVPMEMAEYILKECRDFTMPGWEPERLADLKGLFERYADVDKETLWANFKYFLEAIMPTCNECGIKMAVHPDDPPWDIFGLPRLITGEEGVSRLLSMVDDPCNCLTLCSGSLGASPDNNVADIARRHADRIPFAHIRNVHRYDNGDFTEVSHRDRDGDVGVLDIITALYENGFDGYIRPDHGRHIWGEKCRPGYGLYDRALGIMYILGAWDMLDKRSLSAVR
ncbi:MAG: mannonate dehydratase [Oscillospiraceae bacterium]|nr:mannonate dehydratase [Oscillospiraceae bacterium]